MKRSIRAGSTHNAKKPDISKMSGFWVNTENSDRPLHLYKKILKSYWHLRIFTHNIEIVQVSIRYAFKIYPDVRQVALNIELFLYQEYSVDSSPNLICTLFISRIRSLYEIQQAHPAFN
jgi:hypothetical protein